MKIIKPCEISIFKIKEGVNYNEDDPNYDLFELACKVSAKRLFPNFSFLDSPFNKQYLKEGDCFETYEMIEVKRK